MRQWRRPRHGQKACGRRLNRHRPQSTDCRPCAVPPGRAGRGTGGGRQGADLARSEAMLTFTLYLPTAKPARWLSAPGAHRAGCPAAAADSRQGPWCSGQGAIHAARGGNAHRARKTDVPHQGAGRSHLAGCAPRPGQGRHARGRLRQARPKRRLAGCPAEQGEVRGGRHRGTPAGCPSCRRQPALRRCRGTRRHRSRLAGWWHGWPDRPGRCRQVFACWRWFPGRGRFRLVGIEVLGGDIGDRHFRGIGAAAHRLHAAGPGQEPLPDAVGGRERRFLRPPVRPRCAPSARSASTDLLAATGLAPFRDRPAAKLSGGMKQKLGLCCALIHDPDLLILDEPTTGVDPLSRAPVLGADRRHPGRTPGHERAGGHRLHGGSAALRLADGDGRTGQVLAAGTPAGAAGSAPASDPG